MRKPVNLTNSAFPFWKVYSMYSFNYMLPFTYYCLNQILHFHPPPGELSPSKASPQSSPLSSPGLQVTYSELCLREDGREAASPCLTLGSPPREPRDAREATGLVRASPASPKEAAAPSSPLREAGRGCDDGAYLEPRPPAKTIEYLEVF